MYISKLLYFLPYYIQKLYLFVFLLLIPAFLFSQNSIEGKIENPKGEAVPFCVLGLLNAKDSSIVKGNVSSENGEFIFEKIPSGNYFIKATSVGYSVYCTTPFSVDSSSKIRLDKIVLNNSAINLNEVSVNAVKQTIEFKDGNIVMNVEDSPLSAGNTVFDLLKRLPGVFVDNQNNIFLNGKQNVRILIDGRIQRLSSAQLTSILMSMSAENISKIEIMNDPSVKYDAEGTGGMINILTKKIKITGFSGDISAGVSKGVVYRGGTDGSLNYKGKKFTLFSSAGYGHRDFYRSYYFNKIVTFNGNKTYLNEDGEQTNYQRSFYYRLGADWFVTDKTTIGFFATGGPGSTPMWDRGINRVSGYNDVGFNYTLFDVNVTDKWSNPNYNLNFEHKFDSLGSVLNAATDYSNFKGTKSSFSDNGFYDVNNNLVLPNNRFKSEHVTDINILTQNIDYKKYFSKTFNIETGAKATFVNNKNRFQFEKQNPATSNYVLDTLASNNYKYAETIYAGYLSINKQFKKTGIRLGLRAENTVVDAADLESDFKLKRNYTNLFPNFSIDHNEKNNSYQFKISRRIFRPGYQDLNPYRSYQDNYSISTGNPYLIPQKNLNFSFTHGFKHTIYTSLTYVRAKDFMLHYDYQIDSTKETVTTATNMDGNNYHIWGSVYIQKQIKKWWNLSMNAYTGFMHFQGILNGSNFERPVHDYNIWTNNDFSLPKDIKLQVTMFYAGPTAYGVFQNKSKWALDIGLRKNFFKDKLSLNVTMFDVFYKNVEHLTANFQNMNLDFRNPFDTRRVWVFLRYKFGKIKVQKRQVEGNDSEKSRIDKKLN